VKSGTACLFLSLCVGAVVLGLLAGFVPGREDARLFRRGTDMPPAGALPGNVPGEIGPGAVNGGWFYSDAISREERGPVYAFKSGTRGELLAFTRDGVALLTAAGALPLRPAPEEHMRGAGADAALPATILPAGYGEALDLRGRPLRLSSASGFPQERSFPLCPLPPDESPPLLSAPAPQYAEAPERTTDVHSLFSRARRYKALVERLAERFHIESGLVYAIIHNESNFRPDTVSSRRAVGLMQLLPSTAGGEVHKFLHGRPGELGNDELMDPENNLRYGVAYLHILLTRHFGDVTDPRSRELCAIAAYNLGPNALLSSFARDRDEAVALINSMSPEEIYTRLARDLPVRETRNFIAKVLHSKEEFSEFQ
jgi:membrane-bound lytic murein transglycosylase C